MMECRRNAGQAPDAASIFPVIRNVRMVVSTLPGLGLDLDDLKANMAVGEPDRESGVQRGVAVRHASHAAS
jgi:hypothetical protein